MVEELKINRNIVLHLRIAALILVVQNVIIPGLFLRIIPISIGFLIVFNLDLVGFLLLAIGYLRYSTQGVEKKWFYRSGAMCILGWFGCRILVQYILPLGVLPLNLYITDFNTFIKSFIPSGVFDAPYPNPVPSSTMVVIVLIGTVLLSIGAGWIWRTQQETSGRLFLLFGVLNVVAVIIVIPYNAIISGAMDYHRWRIEYVMGWVLKGLVVPIIGAITFYLMWKKDNN
jgi:hypothetical protein